MENILTSVNENSLVLIPVLVIIGTMLKGTSKVSDKLIPIILLPIGVALAMCLNGANVQSVIQGILVAGASVYANQVVKQFNKEI